MKIGIIQVRGAGDCIIAMPIAKWYYDQGHEIYWTIENIFCDAFQYAFPYVNFIPITPISREDITGNIRSSFWYDEPRKKLDEIGMDTVFNFCYEEIKYEHAIPDLKYRRQDPPAARASFLKIPQFTSFDTFKYAMAKVPLIQKWKLDVKRNEQREKDLFNKLIKDKDKKYIVCHLEGEWGRYDLSNILTNEKIIDIFLKQNPLETWAKDIEIIKITPMTDNIFDWTLILEKCNAFFGIDSFFTNYIDQLLLPIPFKFYARRSAQLDWCATLGTRWDYIPISFSEEIQNKKMVYK